MHHSQTIPPQPVPQGVGKEPAPAMERGEGSKWTQTQVGKREGK